MMYVLNIGLTNIIFYWLCYIINYNTVIMGDERKTKYIRTCEFRVRELNLTSKTKNSRNNSISIPFSTMKLNA